MRIAPVLVIIAPVVYAIGCGGDDAPPATSPIDAGVSETATPEAGTSADWVIAIDPAAPRASAISPALLGQYDLSGALFAYDKVPDLIPTMKKAGFTDWRVGVGRWEVATELFPKLTDNTDCGLASFPQLAFTKAADDLVLIAGRDWFTYGTGAAVTLADTQNDARYDLRYVRSVIDVAKTFGARPLLDIDHMPRAFSINKTPSRTNAKLPTACQMTWSNTVSNARPADEYLVAGPSTPPIFATAVVGLVKRIVEGSNGEAKRDVQDFEIWNEPELPYAWDPAHDDANRSKFFTMAAQVLLLLDAYRAQPSSPKTLRFGLGSFANADVTVAALKGFDAAPQAPPVDFFSFHSYSNDPNVILADIAKVAAARKASTHYAKSELMLTEWGPNLDAPPDPSTIETSLLVATVLVQGAALGIERAYHSILYDFYPGIPFGIVDNAGKPKPLHRAYELLARAIGSGGERLAIASAPDGKLDANASLLVVRDPSGKLAVLVVNRGDTAKTLRVDVSGTTRAPAAALSFADPKSPPASLSLADVTTVSARSIVLLEVL